MGDRRNCQRNKGHASQEDRKLRSH